MKCPHCQSENLASAMFCDECGARLESPCPNCGEPNRHSAKFCRNCSHPLAQIQASVPRETAALPPALYLPKYLADKIRASVHTLTGERKQVTILFADIRGSTSLIEGLDPEEAQGIIDPVVQIMMEAVHRYEGTVAHVLGDGIMAIFGAPLAHEDHALRACYAALAMQEGLQRHRKKLGQSEEAGLQIGVGLNTGEVVVRSIDIDLNIDYSAVGQTTHLAARMQELAAGGAILITSSTLREVEGFVQVKPSGAVQPKGVSRPINTYEIVGATTARTHIQATAMRGLTPFVGRKTEVEIFTKLVEQTAAGRGQVLALVGEAGMGKSRLVHEFKNHQLPSDWLVLEAASVSYGKATPYFPLVEMLRRYFEIAVGDSPDNILEKVVTHLLALDKALTNTIPAALSLLGALPDDKEPLPADQPNRIPQLQDISDSIKRFNDMDPQQRRRHRLDALKRVLIRESQRQPLLAIFEDLHWVDNETQAFLDLLVESVPMARLLLVVNYRPGYSHSWGGRSYYTQLRIGPLPSAGAGELLGHLLGNNPDLKPLGEMLIERTEGNPFFAEETVRSLVESGFLTGEKGAYCPALRIDTVHIPSTIQNVVADRIDRLPIEEKHLLQTAAVIGLNVPFRMLSALAELPDEELYQYLAHLQSAEFIYETKLFPELEYAFTHALTSEVAYGALIHEQKTSLHAKTVAVLEEITGENLQDHVETLARHALRGELWEKAVAYAQQAGRKAMLHSGFTEASSWYDQAFQALKHLPESRAKLEQEIDLHLDSRNVLFLLGHSFRVAEHLHAAEALAERLADRQRLARVLNFLNSYYGLAGDAERAIQFGHRALALISGGEEPALNVVAHYYLGAAYNKLGQYSQAIKCLKHGMRGIEGDLRHERFGTALVLSVICRSHLVQCLAATGRFEEGVAYGEEGIRIAEEVGHSASLIHVNCSVGVLFLIKGDLDKAIIHLERALNVCHSASVPVYVPFVASRLGSAYANSGRVAEALPYLEQGVENSVSAGRLAFLSLSTAWLGEGYLLSGRLAEAGTLAERARQIASEHKERAHEAWALKLLGDIALHHGATETERAEAYYRRAMAVSRELEMRPLQAHCHVGLGNVCIAREMSAQGRAELSAAADLYRSMEMTFWLNRAEATLKNI